MKGLSSSVQKTLLKSTIKHAVIPIFEDLARFRKTQQNPLLTVLAITKLMKYLMFSEGIEDVGDELFQTFGLKSRIWQLFAEDDEYTPMIKLSVFGMLYAAAFSVGDKWRDSGEIRNELKKAKISIIKSQKSAQLCDQTTQYIKTFISDLKSLFSQKHLPSHTLSFIFSGLQNKAAGVLPGPVGRVLPGAITRELPVPVTRVLPVPVARGLPMQYAMGSKRHLHLSSPLLVKRVRKSEIDDDGLLTAKRWNLRHRNCNQESNTPSNPESNQDYQPQNNKDAALWWGEVFCDNLSVKSV